MLRNVLPVTIALAVLMVAWSLVPAGTPEAQAAHRRSPNDMFYNYYVPPGWPAGVGAQLYLCPRPTPPLVGHTYITYQPLMPHEFLYKHHRKYWRKNPGAGWTRTSITWQ